MASDAAAVMENTFRRMSGIVPRRIADSVAQARRRRSLH
jgi:hypothetical protein